MQKGGKMMEHLFMLNDVLSECNDCGNACYDNCAYGCDTSCKAEILTD